jgi:hypothetical protein
MTYGRSADRHSKSTLLRLRPGERPRGPQRSLPWVLGHSAGRTRERARGRSAHEGTLSHGLRWLGPHDVAAVSAQAPQDAIWEDLHMRPCFWAERATWGNRGKPMTRLTKGWFTFLLASVVLTNAGCFLGIPLGGGALM